MKPISLAMLISLGEMDRYLFDAREGWRVHGKYFILSNLQSLLRQIEAIGLPVTLEAANELRDFGKEFEGGDQDARLSAEGADRLMRIMDRLRHTLNSEARTLNAYVLREKKFDVKKLVEQPEFFLGEQTFSRLPDIAQFDFRQAGRCIAFELPTAGAFHLLRATEDTLRSYYGVYFKRDTANNKLWGPLVEKLRAKSKQPKPHETLLNHLDHIRKNFRNPTDHPEMKYDMEGVQNLFSLVVDVLDRMAKELPEAGDVELLDLLAGLNAPPASVDAVAAESLEELPPDLETEG